MSTDSTVTSCPTSTATYGPPASHPTTSAPSFGGPGGYPGQGGPPSSSNWWQFWQHSVAFQPPNSHNAIPGSTIVAPKPSASAAAGSAGAAGPGVALTNYQQVGNSTLGTLNQPYLPQWLDGGSTPPWGANRTVYNSDATVKGDIPVTNVTRFYDWTVKRSRISADGVLRDVILVNDMFPGPIIEANWGDWIQVTVHNNISSPFEGTSLHWHGQIMKGTPWEDGVPGAGQCPIAPGHSFTYFWRAELFGSSWWHAHYSAQYTAGVAGPMVVHGPSPLPYDNDVGPVMVSDWYHIPYFSIVSDAVGTNFSLIPPTSDAVLINGRGRYNCSDPSYASGQELLASNIMSNISWQCTENAPLSMFRFQSGKVHRLRLINHGSNGVQKISIDNHMMTVIETDHVPNIPYNTSIVTLGVGQRTDVLVTANMAPNTAVWLRTHAGGAEPCGGSQNPDMMAAIYYEGANTNAAPTSSSSATNETCLNDALTITRPAFPITPTNTSFIQNLELTLEVNSTGSFEFRVNGQRWHVDLNVPLLPQYASGNFTFEPQWNVYNFYENNTVILNITNNMPLVHPFHLHGHNFYVLNSGATWNGEIVNPENPMRRDGILIPPYGFAAIQFELDNPGVWPLHCHVAWHLSGGQGIQIAYRHNEIVPIPSNFTSLSCDDWSYYSQHNVVDQIDAGA
ncbi:hypothetical protein BAUCODRAFT_72110 [Baudoinia panamericana UAMH 10762]|uniref:Multicopper oxidase n=1 Tax=Baudoinia panamericana (strain UAMH 10762) TaxID=717646 RepID=M2N870_BAUPA|nr:uncharacterized protein BAUCODRAFT_72110 [Baudoinia panamericana UAMH 10762]EMC94990.1 hypothetical protein BAUCODRAFT_72110 [Baudoinia panamericana UAMH 10762]